MFEIDARRVAWESVIAYQPQFFPGDTEVLLEENIPGLIKPPAQYQFLEILGLARKTMT